MGKTVNQMVVILEQDHDGDSPSLAPIMQALAMVKGVAEVRVGGGDVPVNAVVLARVRQEVGAQVSQVFRVAQRSVDQVFAPRP